MRAAGNEASDPVDKERFLNFAADFEQLSERATAFTDKRAKTLPATKAAPVSRVASATMDWESLTVCSQHSSCSH